MCLAIGVLNYSLCSFEYKKLSIIINLTVYQKSALTSVRSRKDMFVSLPTCTGHGKSLIFEGFHIVDEDSIHKEIFKHVFLY